MVRNWIAVASAEHVRIGRANGFMQVCHGKVKPLLRTKPGDWIVYYSPSDVFGEKDKLQSFTAIGIIKEKEPYQIEMGHGFRPFRRDVCWLDSRETKIKSLLDQLQLTKNKKSWGYQFRFGLIEISEYDRQLIAKAMKYVNNNK